MRSRRDASFESKTASTVRHDVRPGDQGRIIGLHGTLYAEEYGFDPTFEAYVAGPLSEFVRTRTDRDRIWIAEQGDRLVGCIAIVGASESEAQLRWFLVAPSARGRGLGTRLLRESIEFCRAAGFASVFLWTVGGLTASARLYAAAGFQRVEANPVRRWGVDTVEERWVLQLGGPGPGVR